MKKMSLIFVITISLIISHASLSADRKEIVKAAYAEYQKCLKANNFSCALKQAKLAYEIAKEVYPDTSKNLATLHSNYGLEVMRPEHGKSREKAYNIFQQALPINKNAYGEKSQQVLSLLVNLTKSQPGIYTSKKEKKPYWKQAVQLSEGLHGSASLNHAYVLMDISNAMLADPLYDSKKTKKHVVKAHEIFLEKLGHSDPRTAFMALNLGKFQMAKKRYNSAANHLRNALVGFEKSADLHDLYAINTHELLVLAYERMGARDKATKHCLAIGAAMPSTTAEDYKPLFKAPPEYPATAGRGGKGGHVILRFSVDKQGYVKDISVAELEGTRAFIKPSIKAVKNFRYAPQFSNGEPIEVAGVETKFIFRND